MIQLSNFLPSEDDYDRVREAWGPYEQAVGILSWITSLSLAFISVGVLLLLVGWWVPDTTTVRWGIAALLIPIVLWLLLPVVACRAAASWKEGHGAA